MGLVDEKRDERDSWFYRMEEHRLYDHEPYPEDFDHEMERMEIEERLRNVGKFPKLEGSKQI